MLCVCMCVLLDIYKRFAQNLTNIINGASEKKLIAKNLNLEQRSLKNILKNIQTLIIHRFLFKHNLYM